MRAGEGRPLADPCAMAKAVVQRLEQHAPTAQIARARSGRIRRARRRERERLRTDLWSATGGRNASVISSDRFYSVAELAEITGYHRDSIYRAIERGALAAAKPRGKWLIAGTAINAWLDTGRTKAPEPRGAAPRRRVDERERRASWIL